jgi:hypothetical protein
MGCRLRFAISGKCTGLSRGAPREGKGYYLSKRKVRYGYLAGMEWAV